MLHKYKCNNAYESVRAAAPCNRSAAALPPNWLMLLFDPDCVVDGPENASAPADPPAPVAPFRYMAAAHELQVVDLESIGDIYKVLGDRKLRVMY